MLNRRQFLAGSLLTAFGCCLGLSGLSGVAEAASVLATGETRGKNADVSSGKKEKKTSRKRKKSSSVQSQKDLQKTPEAVPRERPSEVPKRLQAEPAPVDPGGSVRSSGIQDQEPDLAESSVRSVQAEDIPSDAPEEVRDYLVKMRNYDMAAAGDVILPVQGKLLLDSVMARLARLQGHIGHGNFYLIGIDEAVRYARRPAIGAFTKAEVEFLEKLFYSDAALYGFLDKKPLEAFTSSVRPSQVVKVQGMGNYVYKGASEQKWLEIRQILGDEVVLTSGVRGLIKQFYLFLAKAQNNGGNLSLASRSLAPPGYSFHAVGDFDVGQRGFGVRNFMADFTSTPVYRALSARGYITLRYPRDNFLGVRFEPWHVKVVS